MGGVTGLFITTLAYSEPAGSNRIGLCSLPAEVHFVTVGVGTPRAEKVRVWDCYGSGPCVLWLGYDSQNPVRLLAAHLAGTAVRIEPISREVATARRIAAERSCWHPNAVPIDVLGQEVVAWLCPACDEVLPADWDEL